MTIEIDPSRFRSRPFAHQLEGVRELVRKPNFALFDEMGAGKSKQVVDAACALYSAGVVDVVLVVAPGSVRNVWLAHSDTPELDGEIHKHAWDSIGHRVFEFHVPRAGSRWVAAWETGSKPAEGRDPRLVWVVSNYEYLRSRRAVPGSKKKEWRNLPTLYRTLHGHGVMLILDEASYIKSPTAEQTKAVFALRDHPAVRRRVLLNGTPVADNPLDLYAQITALSPEILGRRWRNFWEFKSTIALTVPLGGARSARGRELTKVVGYHNLDLVQDAVRPYCLRREKKDCLDLPAKLYSSREVALCEKTWDVYRSLRDEALAELPDGELAVEPNAAVRLLRLAQITSGLLGRTPTFSGGDPALWLFEEEVDDAPRIVDLSDEKLRFVLAYLAEELAGRSVVLWTRWRRERERLVAALRAAGERAVYELYGGERPEERRAAVDALMIGHVAGEPRRVLVAQPRAGGLGLNLTGAAEVVYVSNDYSLMYRLQSEDRSHRPGQRRAVTYVDVLATGPKGQKTIDAVVRAALARKEEVARFTCARWRRELEDEDA